MPRWPWPSSFTTRWLSIFKMAKLHTCLVSTFWQLIWEEFHKFFTTAWQRTQRSSCCACGGSGGRKNCLRHCDQPPSQRGETIMIVIVTLRMFNITFVLLGYIWCIICSKANWIIWCSPSKYLMLDVLQQSTWCSATKYLMFFNKVLDVLRQAKMLKGLLERPFNLVSLLKKRFSQKKPLSLMRQAR